MDLFHKKELASLKSELTRLKGLIPDEAIDKADFLLSLDDKIMKPMRKVKPFCNSKTALFSFIEHIWFNS